MLAAGALLAGCGSSGSKVEACAAWDTAMRADEKLMAGAGDPQLPDTGDIEADVETALEDLEEQTDQVGNANSVAKDAFSKAAAEDPEWEDVQEAAYEQLSSGGEAGKATVTAACDRLRQ